jgi:hypothetical protein
VEGGQTRWTGVVGCGIVPLMSVLSVQTLRAVAPALAWALSLSAASAAESDPIHLRFEMYAIAGLHVITVNESLSESTDHYKILMQLKTRGIADLFSSIDSRTEVDGRIIQDRPYSQSFRSDIRRGNREFRTVTTFGPEGVSSFHRDPPLSASSAPLTPELLRGAIDEHSAYYRLERQLSHNGSCVLTVPVFDGVHRFDLIFTDLPPKAAAAGADNRFAAPTRACEMTRRNLAGFPADGGKDGVEHGRMWFAHLLPGAIMLPVRIELDTEIGTVTGYLAEVHGRGTDLAPGQ